MLAILGVAVGVMALTAVMGVMNGFQLGFIESILEISSYHLQIRGFDDSPAAEMLDSRWAKQVKGRAVELAEIMRGGE